MTPPADNKHIAALQAQGEGGEEVEVVSVDANADADQATRVRGLRSNLVDLHVGVQDI